jgi:hypothetical protein
MKAPKQHNWMGADLSSSGPQPRPYFWMYDEGQCDHHVLQFRQDRARDAALLATAPFESSRALPSRAAIANMSVPVLSEILKSQLDERSRRREIAMRLAQIRPPFK